MASLARRVSGPSVLRQRLTLTGAFSLTCFHEAAVQSQWRVLPEPKAGATRHVPKSM